MLNPLSIIYCSVFFFLREKKQPFRENSQISLPIIAWKFRPFRENIVKTAREINNCVRENFSYITYVKMVKSVREKCQIFFSSKNLCLLKCGQHLNGNSSFCTCEKRNPYVKIFKKYLHPPRENKNPYVKKSFKVPVKIFFRPWKLPKKCAWKWFFVREKTQKLAKKEFHAHFWFSRRKKKTLLFSEPQKGERGGDV